MRRRTWALILQIDSNISSHLGLPRRVPESQFDTAEPRSLYDTDFDESTTELPPPRPETEVTAALYTRTKLRLISIGNRVTDLLTRPSPYTYADALNLIRQLDAVHDAFPASLKWQGFASSIAVPSQLTIQRIWLEMCVLRGKLALMNKFLLAPHRADAEQQQGRRDEYAQSRLVCVDAATKILEFQHFLDEETRVDGLLYQSRWNITATFMNDFLLAASILCFILQITPPHGEEQQHQQPRDEPGSGSGKTGTDSGHDIAESFKVNGRIRKLLRMSQAIWRRRSAVSKEARKVTAALRYVLGDSDEVGSEPGSASFDSRADVDGMPNLNVFSEFATGAYLPEFSDLMPGYDLTNFNSDLPNNIGDYAGAGNFQQPTSISR
ncbi:hypothetical protein VTI28DRAFT_5508 [Corynascus sepedonium]